MAGTLIGGKNAGITNRKRYGEDFYRRIGSLGGRAGKTGGWYSKQPCDCDILPYAHTKPGCAGSLGGKISRRGKKVV